MFSWCWVVALDPIKFSQMRLVYRSWLFFIVDGALTLLSELTSALLLCHLFYCHFLCKLSEQDYEVNEREKYQQAG